MRYHIQRQIIMDMGSNRAPLFASKKPSQWRGGRAYPVYFWCWSQAQLNGNSRVMKGIQRNFFGKFKYVDRQNKDRHTGSVKAPVNKDRHQHYCRTRTEKEARERMRWGRQSAIGNGWKKTHPLCLHVGVLNGKSKPKVETHPQIYCLEHKWFISIGHIKVKWKNNRIFKATLTLKETTVCWSLLLLV